MAGRDQGSYDDWKLYLGSAESSVDAGLDGLACGLKEDGDRGVLQLEAADSARKGESGKVSGYLSAVEGI